MRDGSAHPAIPDDGEPRGAHAQSLWRSRRHLPHFDVPGLVQFITFRLADSVPATVIDGWRDELDLRGDEPADDPRRVELRERIERYSDDGHGASWLRIPALGQLVENAILHFDGERYSVLAWCVMPNHVHVLIETKRGHALHGVVHSWKSFSAKQCNRHLRRVGAFWMRDYFDRFIRDDNHLARTIEYIEANPVNAGLCATPADWRWSSAARRGQ